MKQIAFCVELLSDGEQTFYSLRSLGNGQLVECAFSLGVFYDKLDKLIKEFNSSSDKSPEKE